MLNLTGTDDASKQAMADASERYTAASSQIDQATTAKQAALAKESAIEGLYYVRAARTAMGMDPGPELESLTGQKSAGTVTEDRRIQFEGREIEASPSPSERTPNYYPGGRVAGRPVPGSWYSEPWWKPRWWRALGVWARCCCSARCSRAWTVSATTRRVSKTATGKATRDGLEAGADGAAGVMPPTAAATVVAGRPAAAKVVAGLAAAAGWGGGGDFGGDFGGF